MVGRLELGSEICYNVVTFGSGSRWMGVGFGLAPGEGHHDKEVEDGDGFG
ncbi:hypothetical protein [Candidatus Hodgkinia cicadicola]